MYLDQNPTSNQDRAWRSFRKRIIQRGGYGELFQEYRQTNPKVSEKKAWNKIYDIDENYIYWGLVNPKKDAFNYYKTVFNKNNSHLSQNIKEIIINQKIEKYQPIFGGGFSIIPHKMINTFLKIYKNSLDYILENQILFKDDQTIIAYTIINNLDKFKLISKDKDKIEWFPFIYFFEDEFKINN